ncbi:complement factor H isoform X2 [Eublepharis macularius]|uniref:Complement factor H isoform X2 n=1 Tax=Eublepharis macularius TaxID=481883 RepID=A0AA97JFY3_EUBMA|nr:complement factor H isoform X2 [Eublepharis macularius]
MTFQMLGYTVLFLLWVCCTAQNDDCGPPPRRNNEELAELSVKQSYSHGEIVQYNCRPGYIKLGRIKVRCNNGNWDPVPPRVECQKRPCGHPGDIQFGSFELVRGDEFVFGVRVEYKCDPGYQMLSQTNYRDCRADGWSNDVPHCEVKKCFPVTPPENGRIVMSGIHSLDQEFMFGQAVRFECNAKFKIVGSKQIVCADAGQWHPGVPTCEEIICESGNIVHGYITSLKDIYKEGDELQFSCHNGYKPIDRSVAVCSENGWSTRLECTEIVCSRPEVNNGRVNPHQEQYSHEQPIQIECDNGYKPERQGTTSKCTKDGWIPQPRCVSKLCDYPETENIEVYGVPENYKDHYFPKRERATIYFQCINGFLSANKQAQQWQRSTCTKSGWDPEPKCFKQCDHTISFPHVKFIHGHWSKFIEGDDISFSCETGYYPEQQEAKAKCTKNGWSPTPRCITREIPTCQRDSLPNGFFTDQKDQFALNERTRYSCRIGFTTPEGHEEGETQCRREGWTPKPECVQTCQKPTEENVIISMNKPVFFLKENLHYKCKVGYETTKKTLDDNSTCTVNGWSPSPQCLPIHCEGLILDNGTVQPRKDQYLYSDVVRFSCHSGHKRVGPVSAQCYHFGWSPPPPICKAPGEVNSCQPPSNITDGRIITDFQEEYPHGQQVEYECNLKYAMTGSKKIECVDGQWTSLPSCTVEKRTCGPLPSIQNGHAVSRNKNRYFHGDTVRYECDEAFAVVGTNPAKCLHGKWDLPSCAELCPPPPHVPNAAEIIEVRNYENGEKMQFTCKKHFLLEGPEEISCEDGKWETPPRCIDASCGDPPPIANGGVVNGTQGKYLPEKRVEYRCNEGFGISRIKFSTCRNRVWSQTPSCKEKPCGPPPQVFDASLTMAEKKTYQPGEIVHYVCHPGFATDGPLNVTCRKGQWTKPPKCEDATCEEPPTVSNAAIISERSTVYMPGHRVQYRCSAGFEMSGSDSITCGIKVWSEPPTCEDVTCPPPSEIAHRKIVGQPKERYMPSDTVRFQCIQGRSLFGPAVATCFNMQWTELPRCIDAGGNCGRPPSVQNGDVLNPLQAQYAPGTTLQYKCQFLYLMNGTSQVHCRNGHWTEAPTCIEACTISEEDMAQNNIQLKWTNDKKLYSESGDAVEFICKWHYRKDPSSPPFRTQCIEGKVTYPRCI